MRKIIQIEVAPEQDNFFECLYALCDDGTVWSITKPDLSSSEWVQIKPIPQPGEDLA